MRDLPLNKQQQKEGCFFLTILLILSIIGLVVLTMTGCSQPSNVEKKDNTYIIKGHLDPLDIIIIDSCECLYGDWERATVLTHKGNCKNPIHKMEQRNDSIIEDQKHPEYKYDIEKEIKKEKHFDCYVESAVKERALKGIRWYITTECGVSFYSQHYYSVGSVLRGFKSLKHK